MREPLTLTAAMLLLAEVARADGLAETLMQPDPCWQRIFDREAFAEIVVIEEVDFEAQFAAYLDPCNRVPLDQNYITGHESMFWDQPPLLPPSPVPLGGSLGFIATAMLALGVVKRRMG